MTLVNCGQRVLLNGGRNVIACKSNILQHDWVQAGIIEGAHRLDANITLLDNINLDDPEKLLASNQQKNRRT